MTGLVQALIGSLPYLLEGVWVTLGLVLTSLMLGFLIGVPMALAQVYGRRLLSATVAIYVWIFRGLPNLVLLFLFYFGIFPLAGLDVAPFFVGIVVLGLRSGAYQSQIFRGAIQSIGDGQMLAARSLGMSRVQAITGVILPQAFRIALPGWSNEYPILLTDSAVCYAIGIMEILTRANNIVTQTYQPMPVFLICAGIYILLNYGGLKIFHLVEKRYRIPGFGTGGI